MCGTGATTRWNERYAQIWCIARSRGSGTRKCRMPRHWRAWGKPFGPEVIGKLHERLMELARERGVMQGRKMRVDTTVVETNIHYPTDSSLLGDGARVLTRTMKKVEKATGGLKKRIRDRMRSVNKKV